MQRCSSLVHVKKPHIGIHSGARTLIGSNLIPKVCIWDWTWITSIPTGVWPLWMWEMTQQNKLFLQEERAQRPCCVSCSVCSLCLQRTESRFNFQFTTPSPTDTITHPIGNVSGGNHETLLKWKLSGFVLLLIILNFILDGCSYVCIQCMYGDNSPKFICWITIFYSKDPFKNYIWAFPFYNRITAHFIIAVDEYSRRKVRISFMIPIKASPVNFKVILLEILVKSSFPLSSRRLRSHFSSFSEGLWSLTYNVYFSVGRLNLPPLVLFPSYRILLILIMVGWTQFNGLLQ